jgi:hypothetical protein
MACCLMGRMAGRGGFHTATPICGRCGDGWFCRRASAAGGPWALLRAFIISPSPLTASSDTSQDGAVQDLTVAAACRGCRLRQYRTESLHQLHPAPPAHRLQLRRTVDRANGKTGDCVSTRPCRAARSADRRGWDAKVGFIHLNH